ncbi:hypothetical protein TNIN_42781 [Trichonephila inaurata madagascariensis]|uniref:Uncharacterized protein n=1 Tax=Trichonephila inaurata madagascariensis TaxID=2747483 RepID=A0A8X6WQY3_9ARAC|nr:hypothetical protein TNIN_42781 [Trichonephila inaurata madagascariensis]
MFGAVRTVNITPYSLYLESDRLMSDERVRQVFLIPITMEMASLKTRAMVMSRERDTHNRPSGCKVQSKHLEVILGNICVLVVARS